MASRDLDHALNELGLEATEENVEHMATLGVVLDIYDERSQKYGEVWKQYGALNNLVRAATKVDRLMESWWHNPDGAAALSLDALDDAFDAINYLVFFIRMAQQGNITGAKPERPVLRMIKDNPQA